MKKLITLLCCIAILHLADGQQDSSKTVAKTDTTRITLGKKEIRIVETEDGTDISVRNKDGKADFNDSADSKEKSFNFKDGKKKKRDGGFRGHWDGVEFGFNGFLNNKHDMSLAVPDKFMSLNTNPTKSMNINFNFCQVSQGIIGNSFGMVTGLRVEFNNYFFENNNTIEKGNEGIIRGVYYDSFPSPIKLDKSKLSLIYFTIPIMFEFQFPKGLTMHKRLWIAAGVTGSIKIDSHTKIVYRENGKKQRDKNRDDFNINVLRYGFTGRLGYGDFFAYGNYYPVAFFEKNMGPELYPFSVGVGFHFD